MSFINNIWNTTYEIGQAIWKGQPELTHKPPVLAWCRPSSNLFCTRYEVGDIHVFQNSRDEAFNFATKVFSKIPSVSSRILAVRDVVTPYIFTKATQIGGTVVCLGAIRSGMKDLCSDRKVWGVVKLLAGTCAGVILYYS